MRARLPDHRVEERFSGSTQSRHVRGYKAPGRDCSVCINTRGGDRSCEGSIVADHPQDRRVADGPQTGQLCASSGLLTTVLVRRPNKADAAPNAAPRGISLRFWVEQIRLSY